MTEPQGTPRAQAGVRKAKYHPSSCYNQASPAQTAASVVLPWLFLLCQLTTELWHLQKPDPHAVFIPSPACPEPCDL